jgi:hypothetical protein
MSFQTGDPRAKQAGIFGGTNSGAARRVIGRQKWREKFPEVDPRIADAIYRMGYQAAWGARRSWKQRSAAVTRDVIGDQR